MLCSIAAVVYNILLTFVFSVSIVCAAFMYRMKKTPAFVAIAGIFVSYIIDNVIVFCTEIIPSFADVYDRMFLETPSFKTVCFIIRISCMLYLLNCVMPSFKLGAVLSLSAIHAFSLICVPLISEPDWMVYIYYFFSQIIIIAVCIWALLNQRSFAEQNSREEARLLRRVLLYLLVMTVLVLIEDTYVIFFIDVYTNTGLNIFNRNFSENFLFLGAAIGFVVYTVRYFNAMASGVLSAHENCSAEDQTQTDSAAGFAASFNMTERELEILRLVLDGKSQQEISQILVIALGTVKTHTHNIYSKAGVVNRNQIVAKYQEFLDGVDLQCKT